VSERPRKGPLSIYVLAARRLFLIKRMQAPMLKRRQSPLHGFRQRVKSCLRVMVVADQWNSFAETLNGRSQPGLFILDVHRGEIILP